MKRYRIKENVFRYHLTLLVTDDREAVTRFVREHHGAPPDYVVEDVRAITFPPHRPKDDIVVWIRSASDVVSLAHELIHATFSALHGCGVPTSEENQETFAYMHTFFMSRALDLLGHRRLNPKGTGRE